VAHDVATFNGNQGRNHRSVTPQIVNQSCLNVALEGQLVHLPNGGVVVGILFTDKGHCDSQV